MREITKLMIDHFHLARLGFDFMGYEFKKECHLSFHHAMIPKRVCKELHMEDEGYFWENGAILKQDTAHNYLHTIEDLNPDMYCEINSELIDENIKGYIDMENIRYIDDILRQFEKEYSGKRDINGYPIVKDAYLKRLARRL